MLKLLALASPNPDCCRILESEALDERHLSICSFPSFPLSETLDFENKINFKK